MGSDRAQARQRFTFTAPGRAPESEPSPQPAQAEYPCASMVVAVQKEAGRLDRPSLTGSSGGLQQVHALPFALQHQLLDGLAQFGANRGRCG